MERGCAAGSAAESRGLVKSRCRMGTENHSGVAARTVFPVGVAVARVKGLRHACGVDKWAAYAVKSGGTANPFVLLWRTGFLLRKDRRTGRPLDPVPNPARAFSP